MEADFIHSNTAWAIAGIFMFLACVISIYNVILHLTHYTKPQYQLWIVRILLIVPLYGVVSWLCMKFEEQSLFYETLRDIYEAFVIYCFLALILEYVGGEEKCVERLLEKPDMAHPFPLCFLPKIALDASFLRLCKQGTLQFVIVKPVMAVISLIMLSQGLWSSIGYQIFSLTVYNVSYTVALYALLLFYLAIRDDVRVYNCVRKFFAVKSIVFATYWQTLLILGFSGMDMDDGLLWNDFILCIEMLFFAMIHLKFFPWQEFRTDIPDRRALTNMKGVLSVVDVVKDIKHSFKPAHKEYILMGAKSDQGLLTYKTRTWKLQDVQDLPSSVEERNVELLGVNEKGVKNSVVGQYYGSTDRN